MKEVFQKKYNYKASRLLINKEKPPTLQVNLTLAKFTYEEDGVDSLLIVYYAGHGMPGNKAWPADVARVGQQDNSYLMLQADILLRLRDPNEGELTDLAVTWNFSEGVLQKARFNVFVIFDCCFASYLARSSHFTPRSFEFLAPNHLDPLAKIPGPESFTSSLIRALERLSDDCKNGFTTQALRTKIMRAPDFPEHQSPLLCEPFGSSISRILLAPFVQSEKQASSKQERQDHHPPLTNQVSLELHIVFNGIPEEDDIEFLAKHLKKLMNRGLHRARATRWGALRPYGHNVATNVANRFLHLLRQTQQLKTSLPGHPPPNATNWLPDSQPSCGGFTSATTESSNALPPGSLGSQLHAPQPTAILSQTQPNLKMTVEIALPGQNINVTAVCSNTEQCSPMSFRRGPSWKKPKRKDNVFLRRYGHGNCVNKLISMWDGPFVLDRLVRNGHGRYAKLLSLKKKPLPGRYRVSDLRLACTKSAESSSISDLSE